MAWCGGVVRWWRCEDDGCGALLLRAAAAATAAAARTAARHHRPAPALHENRACSSCLRKHQKWKCKTSAPPVRMCMCLCVCVCVCAPPPCRMVYAFARDDGVPWSAWAKRVHPKTQVGGGRGERERERVGMCAGGHVCLRMSVGTSFGRDETGSCSGGATAH